VSEPAMLCIGGRTFAWGRRTYVMAILNVTPDSFAGADPGEDLETAVQRARDHAADGADILDIGGESSRPGATPVPLDVEMARVIPIVERVAAAVDLPISIDTAKPEVARAALRAGATIVNDIHGLRATPAMAHVAAEHNAVVVMMANMRGRRYGDVVRAVIDQLRDSLAIARRAGIAEERLILDPGFGFGPQPDENLELIRRLGELRALGRPLLIGVSRKSTIGLVLGGLPVAERLEGTAAAVALAIANGADIVRVHDTRTMVRVARMADAIVRGWDGPKAETAMQPKTAVRTGAP
jgi:dihydropteroate synthase